MMAIVDGGTCCHLHEIDILLLSTVMVQGLFLPQGDACSLLQLSPQWSKENDYPRDHDHQRSNSRSWDNQRRSQSHMKFGRYSRDCNRRTWSRSRSRSRSPVNSRGFNRRFRPRSPINLRDPGYGRQL